VVKKNSRIPLQHPGAVSSKAARRLIVVALKNIHSQGKLGSHKGQNEPEPLTIGRKHNYEHYDGPKGEKRPVFGSILLSLLHGITILVAQK
jgi:hypothetical protein